MFSPGLRLIDGEYVSLTRRVGNLDLSFCDGAFAASPRAFEVTGGMVSYYSHGIYRQKIACCEKVMQRRCADAAHAKLI
jgi:hypothetical protein